MSNRRRSRILIALFAVVLPLGGSGTALAQTARSGGGANEQLMQQLQQLASERTALQAENARLKKELAEASKARDSLKATREALDRRTRASEAAVARSAQEKDAAEGETERLKERMQELIAKFRETAQTLKDVETERASVKESLTARERELTACTAKNEALYKLNDEVLTHMEHQGFWSKVAQAEPFTRLKRVQLENLVDDYRYRAEDEHVQSSPDAPAPEARGLPAGKPQATAERR